MTLPPQIAERIQAVDVRLDRYCLGSAIKLIYCLVDEMAFLSMAPGRRENTQGDFEDFFNSYIRQHLADQDIFDAKDLYAMRCGTLHSGGWRGQGPRHAGRRNIKWSRPDVATACPSQEDCASTVNYPLDDFWKAVRRGVCGFFASKAPGTPVIAERLMASMWFMPMCRYAGPNATDGLAR